MFFIQFETYPAVVYEAEDGTERPEPPARIQASITIVTHPSDHTYNQNINLTASLISANDEGTPCLVDTYSWTAGIHSLPINFDVSNLSVIWPVSVLVECTESHRDAGHLVSDLDNSYTLSSRVFRARSEDLNPSSQLNLAQAKIGRQFTLSSERVLRIVEDFRKAPALQIRYSFSNTSSSLEWQY
jgi:hypothetical protein